MSNRIALALLICLTPILSWADLTEVARINHAEAFQIATDANDSTAYNLKIGSAKVDLSSSLGWEYNDNISQTSSDKLDDVIIRARIKAKSRWALTDTNNIDLNLDLGYRWYLNNNDASSHRNFLDVNPGSSLAFKWWIKNFQFKLYDSVQYLTDVGNEKVYNVDTASVVTNLVTFGRVKNRVGLESVCDLNDLKIFFGYSRDDIHADKEQFKSYNRQRHTFYVTPILKITPEISIGWINSFSLNDYSLAVQNDSKSFISGPSFSWKATPNTTIDWDIYWKRAIFDTNGVNGDNSDYNGVNTELTLNQKINQYLSHSLTFYRLTDLGTVSNTTTKTGALYQPSYWLKENVALRGRALYEQAKDSASTYQEKYIRRLYGVGVSYLFNEQMSMDTFYDYTKQTSDIATRNYDRNRVTMTLNYDF